MPQQPMLDQREGESFIFDGAAIKDAITEKVNNELKLLRNNYRQEVLGELGGKGPETLYDVFYAVLHEQDLDPSCMLIKGCMTRIAELDRAISRLEAVQQNTDPGMLYKLDLNQVRYYGLRGKRRRA